LANMTYEMADLHLFTGILKRYGKPVVAISQFQ